MKSDRERLLDIFDAIESIKRYATYGEEQFRNDELVQIWIIHYLEMIGEASARISADLQELHPEIPWSAIVAMRNAMTHHYCGIDLHQVWDTVQLDLPELKGQIQVILKNL
ncbi:MAG: DUF86 domain-containing protein [Coprothermobacterota bacterium]|nr:DUF86 domain-containing protein [Coprothermobacterota bacterium]